jgi:hypothetical protein
MARKRRNEMRLSAWLVALLLIVTLLALPRSLYACPS